MKTSKGTCVLLLLIVLLNGCARDKSPEESTRYFDSLTPEQKLPVFPESEKNPPVEQTRVNSLPVETPSLPSETNREKSGTISLKPRSQIKSVATIFQILVFPHLGKYSTPQQREKVVDHVTVNAVKTCTQYAAVKNVNQEWVKSGTAVTTVSQVTLNITDTDLIQGPKYFECTDGFLVKRDVGLDEYKYPQDFVAIIVGNTVQLVNLVTPDQYLKGVVPSEVYPSWPLEVLKTQAVAARTYAWWSVVNARSKQIDTYDMDDTVAFQAYTGISKVKPNTDLAVDETQDLVIRSSDGEIIKAYFSADSGGHTADSLDVFKEVRTYCKAKPETYDRSLYTSEWPATVSVGLTALGSTLVKAKLLPAGAAMVSLGTHAKDQSGRVTSLQAVLRDGRKKVIPGVSFSSLMSLRSRLYDITIDHSSPNGATVEIKGFGYGHGVGMSQQGSLQYVKQLGWSFEQILQFYYTDVIVSK